MLIGQWRNRSLPLCFTVYSEMQRFLAILVCIATAVTMSAQISPIDFTPPSSASLMKSVDFPVNTSNGNPDIHVPIQSMSSGNLRLDLRLEFSIESYLQPNQLPDSPGAGWSLNADIQVSRQIRGEDDFGTWGYLSNPIIPSGYDGATPVVPDHSYRCRHYTLGYDEEPDKFYYRLLNRSGMFYFRKSSDGTMIPTVIPSDGTRVSYSESSGRQLFTITDTDGTIYEYSSDHTDYEKPSGEAPTPPLTWKCDRIVNASGTDSITFRYTQVDPYTVYGYRTSGIDVLDDYSGSLVSVTLPYTDDTSDGLSPVFVECPYGPSLLPETGEPEPPAEGTVTAPSVCLIGNPKYCIAEQEPLELSGTTELYIHDGSATGRFYRYIHPEPQNMSQTKGLHLNYLKEIRFRSGSIRFAYAPGAEGILDRIEIRDTSGVGSNIVRLIKLSQSYAYESGANLVDENWNRCTRRLDTLSIDGDIYSFSYSRHHNCGVITDFWGYDTDPVQYYGSTNVPLHNVSVSLGSSSYFCGGRETASLTIGSPLPVIGEEEPERLLDITYPTGGCVRFYTERHRYMDSDGVVRPAAGMRIARIDWHDSPSGGPVRRKFYRYGTSENGCGVLKEPLDFSSQSGNCVTEQRLKYYHVSNPAQPAVYSMFGSERKRTYLPHPTFSADCGTGSWIRYPEVAEYDTEDGSLSGKTVYHYDISSLSGKIYRPAQSVAYPLEEHYWDVGALDSVIFYRRSAAGVFSPVRSLSYTYREHQETERIYQGRIWPSSLAVPVGFGGAGDTFFDETVFHTDFSEFIHNCNSMAVGCMQTLSVTEKIFEDDGTVRTTMTEYEYGNADAYFRPTSTSVTDWTGSVTSTHEVYATDYQSDAEDIPAALVAKNIISRPYEQVEVRDGVVTSAILNVYDSDGDIVRTYSLNELGTSLSSFRLSNRSEAGLSGAVAASFSPDYSRYRLDAEAEYDGQKHLRELRITGEAPVCYLWGYDGIYPIARIENASWEQVEALASDLPSYPSDASLHSLFAAIREALPEAMITGCTYRLLVGMTSETDSSGRTVFYEYDSHGRLSAVRDESGSILRSYEYTLTNLR